MWRGRLSLPFLCLFFLFVWIGLVTARCDPCNPGYYANSTAVQCQICPTGECNPYGSCFPCPAGSHQKNSQQATCEPCPIGFISAEAATDCQPCPPGTTSNITNTSCRNCPAGEYSSYPGSTCHFCVIGKYNSNPGSVSCTTCTGGYYCGLSGTIHPIICPAGYYCPTGSTSPQQCGLCQNSSEGSVECHFSAGFWIFICFFLFLLVCIPTSIVCVLYVRKKKQKQLLLKELVYDGY